MTFPHVDQDAWEVSSIPAETNLYDKLGYRHLFGPPIQWVDVSLEKPPEGAWVLGLCKLLDPILSERPPVIFEVQYTKNGFSDWRGDMEVKDNDSGGWIVTHWCRIPNNI